ncbi:MAG TPA: hypothetical protein VFM37_12830 [Pseudonocardiaceae bacterium]|nr:hypothetical protein [Pseudonocardiaceae bacterium]
MDERELAQLFEAAADDAPPSRFGHADVVVASRRATQRRRAGIAAGSVFAVAVLAGGVALGGDLFAGRDTAERATAGSAIESDQQAPGGGRADSAPPQQRQQSELSAPGEAAAQPGKAVPWPGPWDDFRASCGEADRELAQALARELPAADTTAAGPVPDACPPGVRAVAVPVADGDATGSIYLVLGPVDAPLAAAATGQPVEREQDGASGYQHRTASGRLLLVLSVPAVDGEQPPFAAAAAALAERIGSEF